jgi:hypothetical protein
VDQAVDTLSVNAGEPCFQFVQVLLGGDPPNQWIVITTAVDDQDQDAFAWCIDTLALVHMARDTSLGTKEWLNESEAPVASPYRHFWLVSV